MLQTSLSSDRPTVKRRSASKPNWQPEDFFNPRHKQAAPASFPFSGRYKDLEKQALILMVEDNRADVFLVEEALRIYGLPARLEVIEDGTNAIQWIRKHDQDGQGQQPSAILLNLSLLDELGEDVLDQIRISAKLQDIPVILFTASNSFRERSLLDRRAATFYFKKSADVDEFLGVANLLQSVLSIESLSAQSESALTNGSPEEA